MTAERPQTRGQRTTVLSPGSPPRIQNPAAPLCEDRPPHGEETKTHTQTCPNPTCPPADTGAGHAGDPSRATPKLPFGVLI